MSAIGGNPIDTSLLQVAQAQQVASKAKDKEKAESDRTKRFQDMVDLKVTGVETADAVRELPGNESELAETEHQGEDHTQMKPGKAGGDEKPRVDLKA